MKTRFMVAALTAVLLFAMFGTITAHAKSGPEGPEYQYYDPAPIVEETTSPVQRPFTPPGTGTVVDNVTNEDGKEFFTITSAAGNIFFLIIDRQRGQDNVYFLNAVTERDLLALAEQSGDTWEDTSTPPPIIPNVPNPTPEVEIETTPEPKPLPEVEPEQGSNGGMIILLIIIIIGGGGAGYYFKIYKPKQQGAEIADDDYNYSEENDYYNEPVDDTLPWYVDDEGNEE